MSKYTCILYSILLATFTTLACATPPGSDSPAFTSRGLAGLTTVAVHIDPPVGPALSDIDRYGVSITELEKLITQRLQSAGIHVISMAQSIEDPAAALVELRLRVEPNDVYYSIGLNLSVQRKAILAPGGNAYYPVVTWSDGLVGGVTQNELQKIYRYTSEILDRFVTVYQAQK